MADTPGIHGGSQTEAIVLKRGDRSPLKSLGLFSLLGAPITIYYFLLVRTQLGIPILDDYDAILAFTNALAHEQRIVARLIDIVAWQHNEYKLIFEHSIVAVLFALKGHIVFIPLLLVGNAFVLLIGFVLWLYFCADKNALEIPEAAFAPVAFLLFNLQFAETVNWATGALQNLPVIAFSLLALWLGTRQGWKGLVLSSTCLVLAETSSGNGFFVFAAALPILLRRRAWGQMALWGCLTAGMIALYLFRYHPLPQEPISAAPSRLLFAILFLGGALGDVRIAAPLGICLWALFFYALGHGYARERPASASAMLFLAITAIGVAVTRGEPGLSAEIASRYRIYSCLALIFAYQYGWDRLSRTARWQGRRTTMAVVLITAAALFAARSDLVGYRMLMARRAQAIEVFYDLRHGLPVQAEPRMQTFFPHAADVLKQSINTGVYLPPEGP